jgi:DNA helicase HerA-like ATPase
MTLPRLGYRDDTEADVSIDIDTLIGTRLLVQGVSGSGKSTAIRAMLEQTHGRVQQLVIDREGEFATLREQCPYVLAGKEGDVPADVRTAKLLVRRIVELGASAIVDLSDLKIPEQREWVKRGFEELVHLPRELWRPLLVSLDEGHMFAPERGSGESVATQAVIDLATLGRKRGYCLVVATQRLSKLHKDCAAELLNKFIGYTDDVDLQRAGEQLGMTKEQRAGLKRWSGASSTSTGRRSPGPGAAAPGAHRRRRGRRPPPRGQVRPPAPPAPAEIRKLLAQLQDLPSRRRTRPGASPTTSGRTASCSIG